MDAESLKPNASSTGAVWAGELAEKLGIDIKKFSADYVEAEMPVVGNRQPMLLLNGGAHAVLAETLASLASFEHAKQFGKYPVGIELNATHSRSIQNGLVKAYCKAIHLGKTLCVHEIKIENEASERLSTLRVTNLLRDIE